MSRTITANMIDQKESASYEPVLLVHITPSNPEFSSNRYYGSQSYTLNSIDYDDRITGFGSIVTNMDVAGGIGTIGDWSMSLINIDRYVSNDADLFYLEHDLVEISLVFKTGSEIDADRIVLFAGEWQGMSFNDREASVTIVDSTAKRMFGFPTELVTLDRFPNAPHSSLGKPLYVSFGYLHSRAVNPFAVLTFLEEGRAAPGIMVDQFNEIAIFCNGYGWDPPPAVILAYTTYYREVQQYGQSLIFGPFLLGSPLNFGDGYVAVKMSGEYYENPNGLHSRRFMLWPLIAIGSTDIADANNTIDRRAYTFATIINDSSDSITYRFRGMQKLGTMEGTRVEYAELTGAIAIYILVKTDTAKCLRVRLSHPRIANIDLDSATGLGDGTNALQQVVYTIPTADANTIDERWDFDAFELILSENTTISGDSIVHEVYMVVDVNNISVQGSDVTEEVFCMMSNGGYRNKSQQFADGSVISGISDNDVVHTASDSLQAILRDKKWGMATPESEIDTAVFSTARTNLITTVATVNGAITAGASSFDFDGGTLYPHSWVRIDTEDIWITEVSGSTAFNGLAYMTSDHSDNANIENFWPFDFSITEFTGDASGTRSYLTLMAKHMKSILFWSFDNKWKLQVMDQESDPINFFGPHNITVRNPDSLPEDHQSSLSISPSPIDNIYNDYTLEYGWDYAEKRYNHVHSQTGRYIENGTDGSTNSSPGTTFTSSGSTFVANFVLPGQFLYVQSGTGATVGIYEVASISSQTVLVLATSPGNDLTSVTFYVGPDLNASCVESFLRYGAIRSMPEDISQSPYIQCSHTARLLVDFWISLYVDRRWVVNFTSWWNALNVEIGDLVLINDNAIPFKHDKLPLGVNVDEGLDVSETSIAVSDYTVFTVDDFIQVDNEIMKVLAVGGEYSFDDGTFDESLFSDVPSNFIAVTRGASGSEAALHDSGTIIFIHFTRWRVMSVKYNPNRHDQAIDISVRQESLLTNPIGSRYLFNNSFHSATALRFF